MRSLFFIGIFFIAAQLQAQSGVITINDKAGAGDIISKHIFFNKEHGSLPGYRIQIMSSTSLVTAKESKAEFVNTFQDINATIVFEAPNYKLRVGNYTNRFDANRDLQLVIIEYPNASVVKDIINISDQ